MAGSLLWSELWQTRSEKHLSSFDLTFRRYSGNEFWGWAMLTGAHERGVTLRLIEPGKPNGNAYLVVFNG
jgi:hypothetical protein